MGPDFSLTTIRFASRADALAIAEMSRDLIEHGLGWSWTRERVLRCLRQPEINAVIALRESGRAGFGIMKYGDEEAHLLLLAVRPEHARCGVGTTLVGWLEASACVAGIARVNVEARFGNSAARAFYGRLGYVRTQLMPGYYSGRETSIRMVKELSLARKETS